MLDAITGLLIKDEEPKQEFIVFGIGTNNAYAIFPKKSLALMWIFKNQIKYVNTKLDVMEI